MGRRDRRPAIDSHVRIDPDLQEQWQEALLSRPGNDNPTALAAWNRKHGDLLTAYRQAVESAQEDRQRETARQARAAKVRTRRRRRIALLATTAIAGIVLGVSAIIRHTNQPTEDELRRRELLAQDAACDAHYQQAHHLKLVSKQIDLLKEGEGGWIELYTFHGEAPVVGSLNLSPAELQAGKIGKASVDREAYAYDSPLGIGYWAILERRGGRLVLTLLYNSSGFGELPHNPLRDDTTSPVAVRGEALSPTCF